MSIASSHLAASTGHDVNRVLRNTYMLLAATMVPTVAGAALGMTLNLGALFSGFIGAIAFLAIAMGFVWAIERNKDSGLGVGLLMGFTFFMGMMLSRLLGMVLGMSNGAELVMLAFGATAAVFGSMSVLSAVVKRDLQPLGKFLFIGAVLIVLAALANIFLQSGALMITLAILASVIFSLFVLVDLKAVRDGYQTNYVSATLGVYLSLFNVFQSLLSLLGIFGGED